MAEIISKSVLVDKVAEAAGVSKKDTKAVVDALISTVTEEVRRTQKSVLSGLVPLKKLGEQPAKAAILRLARSLTSQPARAWLSSPA